MVSLLVKQGQNIEVLVFQEGNFNFILRGVTVHMKNDYKFRSLHLSGLALLMGKNKKIDPRDFWKDPFNSQTL